MAVSEGANRIEFLGGGFLRQQQLGVGQQRWSLVVVCSAETSGVEQKSFKNGDEKGFCCCQIRSALSKEAFARRSGRYFSTVVVTGSENVRQEYRATKILIDHRIPGVPKVSLEQRVSCS
jgi:hypothetical protein